MTEEQGLQVERSRGFWWDGNFGEWKLNYRARVCTFLPRARVIILCEKKG